MENVFFYITTSVKINLQQSAPYQQHRRSPKHTHLHLRMRPYLRSLVSEMECYANAKLNTIFQNRAEVEYQVPVQWDHFEHSCSA